MPCDGAGLWWFGVRLDPDVSTHHTIDIVVGSTPGNQVEVWADLLGGLHLVSFYSITLAQELVIDPGTF